MEKMLIGATAWSNCRFVLGSRRRLWNSLVLKMEGFMMRSQIAVNNSTLHNNVVILSGSIGPWR